jgi:hypothetical protein
MTTNAELYEQDFFEWTQTTAAHTSASFSFWIVMIWRARSRFAAYQYGRESQAASRQVLTTCSDASSWCVILDEI